MTCSLGKENLRFLYLPQVGCSFVFHLTKDFSLYRLQPAGRSAWTIPAPSFDTTSNKPNGEQLLSLRSSGMGRPVRSDASTDGLAAACSELCRRRAAGLFDTRCTGK